MARVEREKTREFDVNLIVGHDMSCPYVTISYLLIGPLTLYYDLPETPGTLTFARYILVFPSCEE